MDKILEMNIINVGRLNFDIVKAPKGAHIENEVDKYGQSLSAVG